MSADFKIEFEWLDGDGMRDQALARTFARLEVTIGSSCVTQAFDTRVRSMVRGTHVALLPAALWAVEAWWTSRYEVARSRDVRSIRAARDEDERRWHRRHGWLAWREGFALPELVFSRGDSGSVRAHWFADPSGFDAMPLRFLEKGTAQISLDVVDERFRNLVEGVLARCEDCADPVVEALRARWALLQSATDVELRQAERAARLGLDAYDADDVSDELSEALAGPVAIGERLFDDLLDVAERPNASLLRDQVERLRTLMEDAPTRNASSIEANALSASRRAVRSSRVAEMPYRRGYEAARAIRKDVLHLAEDAAGSPVDIEIGRMLFGGVREETDAFVVPGVRAMATAASGVPFVAIRQRSDAGMRFDRARALYTVASSDGARLITDGFDADQQESRAFAAELLVPPAYLRKQIHSRFVDQDDVEEIANRLGVFSVLVRHQIANHSLAIVVDA